MNRCIIGDCRDVLRDLIAQGVRVQCVVTSPPYWGLRDYGIPPSVWGGDPKCAHSWGAELTRHKGGPHGDGVMLEGGRSVVEAQAACKTVRAGQFCEKCNAWLGCFGLETTYLMYVEHAVEVFRLVREILRDDGTLWLNLGDTYHNGDKGGYAKDRVKAEDSMQCTNLGANFIGAPNRIPQPGLKSKDRCMIPARVAIALQEDGWWLRDEIVWHKKNPMPCSVKDRTTPAHEMVYLLTKRARYYYDADAIKEPASGGTHERRAIKMPDGWDTGPGGHGRIHRNGREKGKTRKLAEPGEGIKNNKSFNEAMAVMPDLRNKRSVWTIATTPYPDAHFATFSPALVEPCVLAGSRSGDLVLDPFAGSGTVGEVAERLGRQWILIDIKPEYVRMQRERTRQPGLAL